jgi:uncharacterized protein YbaR (Trm112 family)
MGNDGGSIPKRRELVKNAARAPTVSELKATAHESLTHSWTFDPLSSLPLDLENIVSDALGRLYNYESILHALLPSGSDDSSPTGDSPPPQFTFASTGIRSLRDVVKLQFKRYTLPGAGGKKEVWACPVSLRELGPSTRAVYLVPCGHVFAEVAMEHVDGERICPECSEGFEVRDVIPILPTEKADVERLVGRLEELKGKGLTHSLKKDKSGGKKKRKAEAAAVEDGEGAEKRVEEPAGASSKSAGLSRAGINNSMTASVTAKVMAEQEENNKRRKLAAQR